MEEKIRLSRWLFTVEADVLDPACKKIRALAAFPNRLLEPRWQSFLVHTVNKITIFHCRSGVLICRIQTMAGPNEDTIIKHGTGETRAQCCNAISKGEGVTQASSYRQRQGQTHCADAS